MSNHYVLDAWAIVALLRREEPAATRIRQLLIQSAADTTMQLSLSLINLGEAYYITSRERGKIGAQTAINMLRGLPIQLIPVTEDRVMSAANLKATHPISYADAFAAGTAAEFNATLLTGDPELINLQGIIQVEALSRYRKQ